MLRTRTCLTLACLLCAWLPRAFAAEPVPASDLGHYGQSAWRMRDGFAAGHAVRAFAQTPDGYLWLGTESGLQRFDGVRSVPWQPPAGTALPDERIRVLRVARDGALWIGTFAGLARWADGKLVSYPALQGKIVGDVLDDREGTVWVSAIGNGGIVCSIRGGDTQCSSQDGRFGAWVTSLYEDGKGALWAVGATGLWRWKPGPPMQYSLVVTSFGQPFSDSGSGALLAVTRNGVVQIDDAGVTPFAIPGQPADVEPYSLLRDRAGALWVGTSTGLLRVHAGIVEEFARADGLSGAGVLKIFEDLEGNIWVATTDGIDRFRPIAAVSYPLGDGRLGPTWAVLADRSGDIWITSRGRLHRWRGGRKADDVSDGLPDRGVGSLFQDSRGRIWLQALSQFGYLENGRFVPAKEVPGGYIDAIGADAQGNVWVTNREAGLVRLSPALEVQRFAWTAIGQSGRSRLAVDPATGAVWLGFHSGTVVHLEDGRVRATYAARDGLGRGNVNDLRIGADSAVWAATDGGLSRLKAGRIATLNRESGLPCDRVEASIVDDDASTWLYMGCGLVRIVRADLDAWSAAVDRGEVPRDIRTTVLDGFDGVRGVTSLGTGSPHIAKSPDGRIWLATIDGVTVVDPRNLRLNHRPPPVHVEQVVADRTTYEASSGLRLPPLVRDLEIDYTALSFVAPEKVRFRYKLDGKDGDWRDAGNRRQALYSDLGPGNYRFQVIAANNSGIWNEEGALLDFSIAPAYWQTTWFRVLAVAAFVALLWSLYQLRLRQINRQFNLTLDARVNERMRIARELHDTLLQSFQGLLLRFQTVSTMLPGKPAAAKETLDSAIGQTAQAITEGRIAVQGLRASTVETNDLALALTSLGEELAAESKADKPVTVSVSIEGATQALKPIVRDEVYRIAAEAMRNAFRHAGAKEIEVELRYDTRQLRLSIRDDGKGISQEYLTASGREGHFGLHGMRERAKLIGGRFSIWTAQGSGTEIELTIPAANAYAEAAPRRSWFARL